MPVAFYGLFKFLWMDHVIGSYAGSLQWTMLEIIPPRDIEKSPKPMESVYSGFAGVIAGINTFDTYLKGVYLDQFSLELVGNEGELHFYLRIQTKHRNMVEAQIYAQFPEAEIIEVEDYTQNFPKVIPNKNWDLWGTDVEFVMPDPYPIRTYEKFEEDITGTAIDPLAAMAEIIGTLKPGQHIWLQLIIQPEPEVWKGDAVKVVQKLAGRENGEKKNLWGHFTEVLNNVFPAILGEAVEFKAAEKKQEQPLEFKLTPVEKDVLKAVEENIGKNVFRTKMRLIVLGRKEVFDKAYVGAFFGAIKQFNDLNLNQFKPHDNSKTYANYILKEERLRYRQRKIYKRYKDRDMSGKVIFLSTKELATVFHFPNIEVKAPSILQVQSKRGSAPSNLPIG